MSKLVGREIQVAELNRALVSDKSELVVNYTGPVRFLQE